jgi:hypothetical protein
MQLLAGYLAPRWEKCFIPLQAAAGVTVARRPSAVDGDEVVAERIEAEGHEARGAVFDLGFRGRADVCVVRVSAHGRGGRAGCFGGNREREGRCYEDEEERGGHCGSWERDDGAEEASMPPHFTLANKRHLSPEVYRFPSHYYHSTAAALSGIWFYYMDPLQAFIIDLRL